MYILNIRCCGMNLRFPGYKNGGGTLSHKMSDHLWTEILWQKRGEIQPWHLDTPNRLWLIPF